MSRTGFCSNKDSTTIANRSKLEVLAFTDPVCTWCWGSEPLLRKLLVWFGDQIRITPVMGGLVKDIREFCDQANRIGGDPEGSNAQIASHWLQASERHGMPVRVDGFKMLDSKVVTTWPQNIAYKAVQLCNPELASKFLRRMREASAAEARQIGRREVLIEPASEVGVDLAAFIGCLNDGSAERAFHEDLTMTRHHGVRSFPTFLIRSSARDILLRGYQSFGAFKAVIDCVADLEARPPQKTEEAVLNFLRVHGRAAPVELMSVFDVSLAELDALLKNLITERRIRQAPAGNGVFWEPVPEGLSCDSVTGVCETSS